MAKTDNKTNSARVAEIASKIHTACSAIGANTRDIAEHQAEVQELSGQLNGIGGTRLGVATEIAAMATAEYWTNGELVQACAYAAKMGNSNDSTAKTVGVFISEMKTFAHPKVRAEFPVILAACQDAWLEEQEYLAGLEGDERKNADAPVKKFKSRIYHLTIAIARAVKDGELGGVLTADDVVVFARANDPDLDEDKVAKVLARAIAGLDEIHGNFGLDEIKVAADYLRTVTAKELLAARNEMLAAAADMNEGQTIAAPRSSSDAPRVSQPSVAPEPESIEQGELVSGAADLDDLMNDNVSTQVIALAA